MHQPVVFFTTAMALQLCVERIMCLTARVTSNVKKHGFAKVLGSSEH